MNDSQKNIEQFNLVALTILNRLYDSFPTPINILPDDLNSLGFSAVPEDATDEEGWDIGTMTNDVLTFLAEERFIRYEADPNDYNKSDHFWKVRLSLKGLGILNSSSELSGSEGNSSIAQKIRQSLATITTTAGIEMGKHVIAEIIKLALKNVAS